MFLRDLILHRDLEQSSLAETLYRNLVKRSFRALAWEISDRDLVQRALARNLLHRSCQDTFCRELVQRSRQKILYRDLRQRSCQETSHGDRVQGSCIEIFERDLSKQPISCRHRAERSCLETADRDFQQRCGRREPTRTFYRYAYKQYCIRRWRKFQRQETYRRGGLLGIMDGRANPLMD